MDTSQDLTLQSDSRRYTWGYFLEDVADRYGEAQAIRFEGRSITFRQLREQSRSLAKSLAAGGVVKGARIAVHMANRPEFIVTSFATALIGAVLVPISTFATLSEREYILRHSDASVLIFSAKVLKSDFLGELSTLIPEAIAAEPGKLISEKVPFLRRIIALGLDRQQGAIERWSDFLGLGTTFPEAVLDAMTAEVFPSDEGMIIYTSGTTAKPKGALHMQRAPTIMSWRFAEYLRYTPQDRIWTAYPFFWTAGIAMAIGGCLGSGAVLILQETFNPEAALRCFVRECVTGVQAWPHQEKALAEHPLAQTLRLPKMSKLDQSSPLAPLVGIREDTWGCLGSYGLTETFTLASMLPADSPADLRKRTAGRPLPGMHIRIIEPRTGTVLPRDVPGEIAVKGSSLMRGYYKVDPEIFLDADGFFHTQDAGHLGEDGYLYWTGRLSNMIKTGGANVSPLEIEEALSAYPNLRVSVSFGAPHPTLGEVIVLCAVPAKGHTLRAEEIQQYLKSKLAPYKRPKAVLMFDDDEVEFTGTQKVQVDKLIAKAMTRLQTEALVIEGVNYGQHLAERT